MNALLLGIVLQLMMCLLPVLLRAETFSEVSEDKQLSSSNPNLNNTIQGTIRFSQKRLAFDEKVWKIDLNRLEQNLLAVGDFNNDGFDDLLSTSKGKIFLSNGKDGFVAVAWSGVDVDNTTGRILVADFDLNLCDDLLYFSPELNKSFLLLSNCENAFKRQEITFSDTKILAEQGAVLFGSNEQFPELVFCPNAELDYCMRFRAQSIFTYEVSSRFKRAEGTIYGGIFDLQQKIRLINNIHRDKGIFAKKYLWEHYSEKYGWSGRIRFILEYDWNPSFVADFNGDGLDDVLSRGGEFAGWWLALTGQGGSLELAVSGLPRRNAVLDHALTGDFNGDGVFELIDLNGQNGATIFSLRPAEPVVGALVFIDGEQKAVSNHLGHFEIRLTHKSQITASVKKENVSFSNPERRIARFSSQDLIINFAAINIAKQDDNVGSAIDLVEPLPGPYVCLGYLPAPFSTVRAWSMTEGDCPKGYAILAASTPDGSVNKPEDVFLYASCCRLPKDDILLDEQLEVVGVCPEGYIATGVKKNHECKECPTFLRCTKINTLRYSLGEVTGGKAIGYSASVDRWKDHLDLAAIPLAIRYGMLRTSNNSWASHGCIGFPWGSVLTGKAAGSCAELTFRQLHYAGGKGGSSRGTPVRMFPDCKKINNIHDPRSGCVVN